MEDDFEKLRELMALVLGVPVESITPRTSQDDLASWDSIGHLNLMLALEEGFGIKLDIDDMAKLTSTPNILVHIRQHTRGG